MRLTTAAVRNTAYAQAVYSIGTDIKKKCPVLRPLGGESVIFLLGVWVRGLGSDRAQLSRVRQVMIPISSRKLLVLVDFAFATPVPAAATDTSTSINNNAPRRSVDFGTTKPCCAARLETHRHRKKRLNPKKLPQQGTVRKS